MQGSQADTTYQSTNTHAGPPASGSTPDVTSLLLQVRSRLIRLDDFVREQQRVRDYYSTAEVAELLGKAEFTVREWCRRGRVRAEKKQSGRGKYQCWVIPDAELKRIQKEGLLPA